MPWFQDTVLKLRSGDGLKVALSNNQKLQNEIEIPLPADSKNNSGKFFIPLIMRSEFPSQNDNCVSDYQVNMKSKPL